MCVVPVRAAGLPEILILGDSQFAFGAGPAFHKFFNSLASECPAGSGSPEVFRKAEALDSRVMGVRSTAILHWSTSAWGARKMVCMPDPKWKVNARLYGWPGHRDGTYVQIGKQKGFDFCRPGTAALSVMLQRWTGRPRLLFLYFTGNSVGRWGSLKNAKADVARLRQVLPAGLPCIFMTTSPVYYAKNNRARLRAQRNIRQAFQDGMNRCQFIGGLDSGTIAAIQGNAQFFRRHKDGRVKDGFHLSGAGARLFVGMKRKQICSAVAGALGGPVAAGK